MGEGSASRPGCTLPPRKTRYPLYRRLGGPQGRCGQVRKISPPLGFDPRTVQPVGSRCTDWATRPTEWTIDTIESVPPGTALPLCIHMPCVFFFSWDNTLLTSLEYLGSLVFIMPYMGYYLLGAKVQLRKAPSSCVMSVRLVSVCQPDSNVPMMFGGCYENLSGISKFG